MTEHGEQEPGLPPGPEEAANIAAIVDELSAELAEEAQALDGYIQMGHAFSDFSARGDTITLPRGEVIQDGRLAAVAKVLSIIGDTLAHASPYPSGGGAKRGELIDEGTTLLSVLTSHKVLRSPWSQQTAQQLSEYRWNRGYIEDAIDYITRTVLQESGQPAFPSLSPDDIREQLRPYQALDELLDRPNLLEQPEEVAGVVEQLPSEATFHYTMFAIYADTLRAFQPHHMPALEGLHTDEERTQLRKNGAELFDIIANEAAMLLNGLQGSDLPGEEASNERARTQLLLRVLGLRALGTRAYGRELYDTIESLRDFSEPARLLVDAHRAIGALAEFHPIRVKMEAFLKGHRPDGLPGIAQAANTSLAALLEAHATKVQQRLVPLWEGLGMEDHPLWTALRAAAILRAEEELLEIGRRPIEAYEQAGLVNETMRAELEELLAPRLWQLHEERQEAERRAAREAAIEGAAERIATLEEPYQYTARKIRGLQGTAMPRELGAELERYRRLNRRVAMTHEERDEHIEQMLAIIVLQARDLAGQRAHFDQLFDSWSEIQRQRATLAELDAAVDSRLVDVLGLVDAVVDAGFEGQTKHSGFKDFLQRYVRHKTQWEQSVLREAAAGATPPVDQAAPAPLPDAVPQPQAERPDRQPVSHEFITEQFGGSLDDILARWQPDIDYVDVVAFPGARTSGSASRGEVAYSAAERTARTLDVDPERLEGLLELQHSLQRRGVAAELLVTSPASSRDLPCFVLWVHDPGDTKGVCVIENLTINWATYAYAVDGEDIQEWDDILAVARKRQEARALGAITFLHPVRGSTQLGRHYHMLHDFATDELDRLRR